MDDTDRFVKEKEVSKVFGRKARSKKWSQVYADKIEGDHIERERLIKKRQEEISRSWAVAVLSRKFISHLRARVERSRLKNQYAVNQAQQVLFTRWDPHLGTQVFCQLCHRPAYTDCVSCISCNSITHLYCIPVSGKGSVGRYKCEECKNIYIEEKIRHTDYLSRRRDEKLKQKYAIYLGKVLLSHVTRVRYLKKRKSIIIIQSAARRFIKRSQFLAKRHQWLRVLGVEIRDIPPSFQGATIILTVIDTMKYSQMFRFEKTFDRFNVNESVSYVLPGVTKNVYVVLTVATREDTTQGTSYTWRAQAQCSLQDVFGSLKSVIRPMKFNGNIQWPPHAQGANQEMKRVFVHSNAFIGESCAVRIKLLNPVLSPCMQIYGPPLDILRKQAEIHSSGKKQADRTLERRSKWWVCVSDSKLLFYHYQSSSDSLPRYYVFLKDSSAYISKHQPATVQIQFADRRKWQFDCKTNHDAMKLAFAVREYRKVTENSSIYSNSDSINTMPFTLS